MKKLLILFGLLFATASYAADNAVVITPGGTVTMRSVDVGSGVQSMMQILGNSSGTTIYGTAGTANAAVLSVQGIASMTPLKQTPYNSSGTELFTSGNPGFVSGIGVASGNPITTASPLMCNGLSTEQTAVTTNNGAYVVCQTNGKLVVMPYAPKELWVRGSSGAVNDTTQTDILAAGSGSNKTYVTDWECSNSGSTTVTVSFNDSATTVVIVPAGGGNNKSMHIPLVTAAATAFKMTSSGSTTSLRCSAQGYYGL